MLHLLAVSQPLAQTWIDLGLLNDILFQFEAASTSWVVNLEPYALATFGSLAALELAWSGIRSVLDPRSSIDSTLELLLRKVAYLGFVFWLIQLSPALLPLVVGSFQNAGAIASGINGLNPSSFLATGMAVVTSYLNQFNSLGLLLDPLAVMMADGGTIAILLAFATMAGRLLLVLIESLIAIAAVPFLLAMAGSRWTSRISEGSLAYVIRVGVKLLVVYLVAGVANGLTIDWAHRIETTQFVGPVSYLGFLGSIYTLALLVWQIPNYAANMVQPTLSFGLSPAVGEN